MQLAIVQENVVISILDAVDTIPNKEEFVQRLSTLFQNVIEITDADPKPTLGWVLNGSTLIPGPGQSATPSMKLTKLAFRNRLTVPELLDLYGRLNTDSMLKIIQDNLNVATYVDLTRPDTQAAVGYLCQIGVLTQPRMLAILTTAPNDIEKYKGPL